MDQHFLALKEIIRPYIQNEEAFAALTPKSKFIEDLEINSANLVDVILDVEDKYEIEIDNESMEKMVDVQAALDIIAQKIESK